MKASRVSRSGRRVLSFLAFASLATVLAAAPRRSLADDFIRGDANADGVRSLSDPAMIQRFLFLGGPATSCFESWDVDDDNTLDITDSIYLLNALFLGGANVPAPGLEVGPDPTPEGSMGCESYAIEAPEETSDVVEIGSVSAAPGAEVAIPISVTNAVDVEAFQLVVSYDPALFTPGIGGGPVIAHENAVDVAGTFYETLWADVPNYVSLVRFPEQGVFVFAYVPNLIADGYETPAGEDRLVFKIRGTVSPDAEPGSTVELGDGGGASGFGPEGLRNELTYEGEARFVSVVPQTLAGRLEIVGDVTIFRGDANHDHEVDISDASFTLSFLFSGGDAPVCPDAADANDDGRLDISDPIATLGTLFLSTVMIAAPYPGIDVDPTDDDLESCGGSTR